MDTDADGTGDACDPDDDGDGSADVSDCAPLNAGLWAAPTEVGGLLLSKSLGGVAVLNWSPGTGAAPGNLVYDTIRSATPANFVTGAICIESNDGPNTTAVDPGTPAPGSAFFCLVRAEDQCGAGVAGRDSNSAPKPAPSPAPTGTTGHAQQDASMPGTDLGPAAQEATEESDLRSRRPPRIMIRPMGGSLSRNTHGGPDPF